MIFLSLPDSFSVVTDHCQLRTWLSALTFAYFFIFVFKKYVALVSSDLGKLDFSLLEVPFFGGQPCSVKIEVSRHIVPHGPSKSSNLGITLGAASLSTVLFSTSGNCWQTLGSSIRITHP